MSSENKKLDSLLSAIVPLMEKAGGTKIYVEYSGCGDCGTATFGHLEDENEKIIDHNKYDKLTACVIKTSSRWTKEGWIEKTEEADQNLIELAEEIAYEMLANNVGGWEINSGSYGGVYIQSSPVLVTLEHTEQDEVEDENGEYETIDLGDEVYYYPDGVVTYELS